MRYPRLFLKILFLLAVAFCFLLFSYPYFLKKVGYFLILEQNPEKADVIVVLNGRDMERSLEAVDLYNKKYANLIVLGKGTKEAVHEEFWRRIGNDFDRRIFFQAAIEAMGIPKSSFKLIGNGVQSTYDEAKVTKDFLKECGYRSILLVTSKWHSRRAYLTFKSAFGKNDAIRITVIPSRYDTFSADKWWKRKNDTQVVFGEYLKMIYYITILRISPF